MVFVFKIYEYTNAEMADIHFAYDMAHCNGIAARRISSTNASTLQRKLIFTVDFVRLAGMFVRVRTEIEEDP